MEESTGLHESTETGKTVDSHAAQYRRGPTWRGWVLSILVAILLSVTATLLLGGSGAFLSDSGNGPAVGHGGSGSNCCPPADAGK
jgi:hypothetical protein